MKYLFVERELKLTSGVYLKGRQYVSIDINLFGFGTATSRKNTETRKRKKN